MEQSLLRQIVELAVRAPSVHNTQPWSFVAGPSRLDVFADRSRQLTVLDPTGRQLVLSCGAAIGTARLAVRAYGYGCDVDLLPNPDDTDHLAVLRVGRPLQTGAGDMELARQIGSRRTVRDRYDPTPLSASLRTALASEAELEQASLYWVDDLGERTALAVLTDRADRIEQADPAIRGELARWQRSDASSGDGVPPDVLPAVPAASRASDVPLRDFGAADDAADPQHLPLPAERPDYAVICTRYDGPVSWLHAGQATARVLLRAAAHEVAASPAGQVLDLAWTRRALRQELGIIGHPQLVLRLGHGRLEGPRTPRRPVDRVLHSSR